MKPKISVIIPCFNEAEYIYDCLKTLSKQSLMPDEVIVCDNASTDSTLKIVAQFKNSLPLKIIHQPVKGIIPTVEKAWRSSTGDIIVRADADARFPVDWLKKLIAHFDDPSIMACGGNWISWDGNFFIKIIAKFAFPAGDIFFPLIRGFKLLLGTNMAFRRHVLEEINGFILENSNLPEDQLISFKLSQAKIKYQRFSDCDNYHSSRSWGKNFYNFFLYVFSAINPKYYPEKSV